MERISIFNYEIFYLDYLEGRLSEEDTRMLMEFFEEHPECKLDDPDLPTLDLNEELTFSGKSDLKQTDDNEAITIHNADHFMISEAEGLLSNEKKNELDRLVTTNEELTADRKRFAAVYFSPEEDMVFAHKGDLKRKKTIVLWPYVSGAVAAAVIGFIFLTGNGTDSVGPMNFEFGAGPTTAEKPIVIPATDLNEVPNDEAPIKFFNASLTTDGGSKIHKEDRKIMDRIVRKPGQLIKPKMSFDNRKLKPLNVNPLPVEESPTDRPYIAMNEQQIAMENPIEPITSFISKKTKTEVDFGRKKRGSKKEKGGFFFKIGNFEISKNKH